MNYYLDTEFLEGTQDKRILDFKTGAKTKPTIDLISIGIVAEDGREYYAVSKNFNLKEAWDRFDILKYKEGTDLQPNKVFDIDIKRYWIRENVLKPIWIDLYIKDTKLFLSGVKPQFTNRKSFNYKEVLTNHLHNFTYKNLKKLINKYGKSNEQIAKEVKTFVLQPNKSLPYILDEIAHFQNPNFVSDVDKSLNHNFYAYCGSYDWVVFCWLFGKMIDLPKGYPKYVRDLKQILVEKQESIIEDRVELRRDPNYPKKENEHNALADAHWNKKLHEFLKTI